MPAQAQHQPTDRRPLRTPSNAAARGLVLGLALVALATFAAGLYSVLRPRTNWTWAWDDPLLAWTAGCAGIATTTAAIVHALRVYGRRRASLVRVTGVQVALVAVAVCSTLVLIRSGSWFYGTEVVNLGE